MITEGCSFILSARSLIVRDSGRVITLICSSGSSCFFSGLINLPALFLFFSAVSSSSNMKSFLDFLSRSWLFLRFSSSLCFSASLIGVSAMKPLPCLSGFLNRLSCPPLLLSGRPLLPEGLLPFEGAPSLRKSFLPPALFGRLPEKLPLPSFLCGLCSCDLSFL